MDNIMISEDTNIFSIGSTGNVVKLIQIKLKELGYELGNYGPNKDGIDGKYGTATKNAVEEFQEDVFKNQSEKHDGIVGTETWQELFPKEKYPKSIGDLSKDTKQYILQYLIKNINIGTTSTGTATPNVSGKIQNVKPEVLNDLQTVAKSKNLDIVVSSGVRPGSKVKDSGTLSRHHYGWAVDVSKINGVTINSDPTEWKRLGDELVAGLKSLGYKFGEKAAHDKAYLWQTNIGGDHFGHVHLSNKSGKASEEQRSKSGLYRNDKKYLITKEVNSTIVKGGPKKYPARSWLRFKNFTKEVKSKNVFVSHIGYKETGGDFYGYKTPIDYTNTISGEISYGFMWNNQSNYYFPNIKAKSRLNVTIVDSLVLIGGYWGSSQPVIFTYFKLRSKTSDGYLWVPSTWVSL